VVELLLTHGADMSVATATGLTAFDAALVNKHEEVVRLLQAKDVHRAASTGNVEAVKGALTHGVDPNSVDPKTGCSLLLTAAQKGILELVNVLIDSQADPQQAASGFTPVYVAVQKGHHDVLAGLLAAKADGGVAIGSGELPLIAAMKSKKNRSEMVFALVASGVSCNEPNKKGVFPLLAALEAKVEEPVLDLLTEMGASPTQQAADGCSFLHQICKKPTATSVAVAQQLVALNCPVDVLHGTTGQTALQIASAAKGGKSMIAALLKLGANPTLVPDPGVGGAQLTALQAAVSAGQKDNVLALLQAPNAGLVVEGRSAGEAVTALSLAVQNGSDEIVQILEPRVAAEKAAEPQVESPAAAHQSPAQAQRSKPAAEKGSKRPPRAKPPKPSSPDRSGHWSRGGRRSTAVGSRRTARSPVAARTFVSVVAENLFGSRGPLETLPVRGVSADPYLQGPDAGSFDAGIRSPISQTSLLDAASARASRIRAVLAGFRAGSPSQVRPRADASEEEPRRRDSRPKMDPPPRGKRSTPSTNAG